MTQKNLLQAIENRQWGKAHWKTIRRKIENVFDDDDKMALLEIIAMRGMACSFQARATPAKENPLAKKKIPKSKSFLRRS
jgi:hypothetical protein